MENQTSAPAPIIDFHTQVYPPVISTALRAAADQAKVQVERGLELAHLSLETRQKFENATISANEKLRLGWAGTRSILKEAFVPLARQSHEMQTQSRTLPPFVRGLVDELGALSILPHLILESSSADQLQAMEELGIDAALTVAFPPMIPSNFVMELAAEDSRRVPVVAFEKNQTPEDITALFKEFHASGARILKVYPLHDGLRADSEFYIHQLTLAAQYGWLVIVHTGALHIKLLMPVAELGEISQFEFWFKDFPQVSFVLAHMGLHESRPVIEAAQRHSNTWVTTSWQPADVIAQAVHVLGAERVLYASDWPLFGENMKVGIGRIRELEDNAMITPQDAQMLLGGSAALLLKSVGLNVTSAFT